MEDAECECNSWTWNWDEENAAEAAYDEPEELFNDAGIPMEPFHMREERKWGYFDAVSGGYVEYSRHEVVQDAWVDALPVQHDEKALWKGRGKVEVGQMKSGQDEEDLPPDLVLSLKRRIAVLLEPGESVLDALKRLGKKRIVRSQRPCVKNYPKYHNSTIAPDVKKDFDNLTEWSNLVMQGKEYRIHSMVKEELESHNGSGSISIETLPLRMDALDANACPMVDMFAESNEDETIGQIHKVTSGNKESATALEGWTGLDGGSGYLYNPSLGAYFDPESSLFGDAATGRWYHYDDVTEKYMWVK